MSPYPCYCDIQHFACCRETGPTKTSINQDLGQSRPRRTDTLSNGATSSFYELRFYEFSFDEHVLTNYQMDENVNMDEEKVEYSYGMVW